MGVVVSRKVAGEKLSKCDLAQVENAAMVVQEHIGDIQSLPKREFSAPKLKRGMSATIPRVSRRSLLVNPDYHIQRKGIMKRLADAGIVSPTIVRTKKILVANDTSANLVFVVSSDPHAQHINSGHFGASTSGGEISLELKDKGVINQVLSLGPGYTSEVVCRTSHSYITVARRRSDGNFIVYRYRRGLTVGDAYTATEGMVAGVDSDVRSSDFLQEFK